jgi:hypothetical protein
MRAVLRRILLSLIGGTVFQLIIYFLFLTIGVPGLAIIFLWGWILFVGEQPPIPWRREIIEWIIVLMIDNLLYATLIYFLLWNREANKETLDKPATL